MTKNESFDDVLDMLFREEQAPSDEALARWSERYPQYRRDLAEFFEIWAMQEKSTEPEPDTDEDWIVEQSVKHAMAILEGQGRLAPVQPVPSLSDFDQLVLTAVYLLGGRGYPVTITLKVGEMQGKRALLGFVLTSLDSLQRKGLILSRPPDPVSEPENVGKRYYYTVTMAGSRALAYARETSTVLARFLPDFA
jgi:hypothetical protein